MTRDYLTSRIRLEKYSQAVISHDGTYRYWLHRRWMSGSGHVVFVMLNPSTADGLQDDPTIRRCIMFSQLWGYQALIVVNLFAARATEPKELYDIADAIGPENEQFIDFACKMSRYVICAWGANKIVYPRGIRVARHIRRLGIKTMCLGTSKAGYPRHPLYLSKDTKVVEFNG